MIDYKKLQNFPDMVTDILLCSFISNKNMLYNASKCKMHEDREGMDLYLSINSTRDLSCFSSKKFTSMNRSSRH